MSDLLAKPLVKRLLMLVGLGMMVVLAMKFPVRLPHIQMAAERLFPISFFGITFYVTNTLIASWLSMIVLIVLSLQATRDMELIPSGLQNAFEAIIEAMYNFAESVASDRTAKFFPLVATIFLFVLVSNLLGLLPGFGSTGLKEIAEHGGEAEETFIPFFRSAATDLNVPLALALISVITTQIYGMQALGVREYLSKFFNLQGLNSIVGILELISEFAKLISFSFRLFGNIFAGEVLLAVMASLIPYLAPVPFFGLEIFVGFMQAFVFAMLTLVFMTMATTPHGPEAEH